MGELLYHEGDFGWVDEARPSLIYQNSSWGSSVFSFLTSSPYKVIILTSLLFTLFIYFYSLHTRQKEKPNRHTNQTDGLTRQTQRLDGHKDKIDRKTDKTDMLTE